MRVETAFRQPERMTRRRCVRCGYGGSALQRAGGRSGSGPRSVLLTCPKCQQDLYTRPARSYAELEGFEERASVARGSSERASTPIANAPALKASRRRLWRNVWTLWCAAAASALRPKKPTGKPPWFRRVELGLLVTLFVVVSAVTVSRIAAAVM